MKKAGTIEQNLPIVNFKIPTKPNLSFPYVVSQLPEKGALPPWIPAPAREAKKYIQKWLGLILFNSSEKSIQS